ncbi:MAG: Glutamate synthase NADPH small chain, partial [bacterium]
AFDRDVPWEMAIPMVERLSARARAAGVTLGAKFSNTLVVENNAGYLPADQKEVYLSGTPLHVLAMQLVARFRDHFGDTIPISFAAGVDRANFPDLVALGMTPITVCSDLLKTGGYGRMEAYYRELTARMRAVGAASVNEFTLKAMGEDSAVPGSPSAHDLSGARIRNTRRYAEQVLHDPRYAFAANTHPPRKIGSHLSLFDCVSCDKCVPVCPNDANFTYPTLQTELPMVRVEPVGNGWTWRQHDVLHLTEKHQVGTFADFCNECGNCDVFCPEDGGPYRVKPNFHGSRASWEADRPRDGLFIERNNGGSRVLGRCDGTEYQLDVKGDRLDFMSQEFRVRFRERDPQGTLEVLGDKAIDMTWCFLLNNIRLGVLAGEPVNYISTLYGMNQGES